MATTIGDGVFQLRDWMALKMKRHWRHSSVPIAPHPILSDTFAKENSIQWHPHLILPNLRWSKTLRAVGILSGLKL
jgi:hypothetical protein